MKIFVILFLLSILFPVVLFADTKGTVFSYPNPVLDAQSVFPNHEDYGLKKIDEKSKSTKRVFIWKKKVITTGIIDSCAYSLEADSSTHVTCYYIQTFNEKRSGKRTVQSNFTIRNTEIIGAVTVKYPSRRNGLKSISQFKNSIRNGEWVEYDTKENIRARGYYQNGIKHGNWIYFHSNGKKSKEESYTKGQKNGMWKNYSLEGSEERLILYLNGMILVHGNRYTCADTIVSINKSVLQCFYNSNEKNKGAILVAEIPKVNGLYEGYYYHAYKGGTEKVEGFFKANKPEGNWKWYSSIDIDQVLVKSGTFKNGSKQGKWTVRTLDEFNENECILNYKNGTLHGFKHCTDQRGNTSKSYFIDGKQDGVFTCEKCGEDKTTLTGQYKKGTPVGAWVDWHPNGQKAAQHAYKNGKLNGIAKMWNSKGELIKTLMYTDGKTVSNL